MEIFYDLSNDTLIFVKSTGKKSGETKEYKNVVKVDFDVYGTPILLEVNEASILFGVPKQVIKMLIGGEI